MNLKKKLTNNLGLKILAIVFAVILWLIVVNINDPVSTTTYSGITVDLLNTDVITGDGKTYEILDESNVVSVTVTAKKSVLSSLSKENIHATADLSELTFMDTVGIQVSSDKLSSEIDSIRSNTVNLKLSIEDVKRAQLVVSVKTTGEPKSGYMIGQTTTEQNIVLISGPQSVINSVARAEAVVDVTDMSADIGTSVEIKLYDSEDRQIINPAIVKNIDTLNVNVEILATKRVPLVYDVMGTPANGYALTGVVESNPTEITIAGSASLLRTISAIEIPETALNVTGQSSDMTATVDITKNLPSGVILADDSFSGRATVVVYIEREVSKTAYVNEKNFSFTNIPPGLDVEIVDLSILRSVTFIGLQADIDQIDEEAVTGIISMNDIMEELELEELEPDREYEVSVHWNIPENVRTSSDFTLTIYVTEQTDEMEN